MKLSKQLNKSLMMLFVLGLVFIALPAIAFADDEDNTTANVTANVTANITMNVTENVTANVTMNVTENITTNTTIDLNETDDDLDDDENETEDVDDDVDLEDVILGNTTYGMEVRLLQLYKSLTKNVEYGQLIVDEIDNQNFSVNTDNLQNILDDANDLNDEIKDLLDEEPVNVSTEEFVALKSESIDLTFQFKKELYNILTAEQMNTIKIALRPEFERNDFNSRRRYEIENRLRERIMAHNREQAMKMYNHFELNNSELRNRIETGNFTSKWLKDELKNNFKNMKQFQKENAKAKINAERERYQNAKAKLSGKKFGLNGTEVEKIINDSSLTWNERETKMRIYAQEKVQEKKTNVQSNKAGNSNGNNQGQNRPQGNPGVGNKMR